MRRSLLRTSVLFLCASTFTNGQLVDSYLFGVSHFPLGEASVDVTDRPVVAVSDIGSSGRDGVRTELGAADSGVFLFPNLNQVDSGNNMRAEVYGAVAGQQGRLIGTISGYRTDYATFYATADFSALGAQSLTFQLWRGNAKVAETTITNGEVKIYAEYSTPPRVNPWWKQADGDRGASIEFYRSAAPIVTLPTTGDPTEEPSITADRIFIRPNGITNTVDSVSRTEVYAGGGVAGFEYYDLRVGMFAHAHQALGRSRFTATNGILTVESPLDTLDPDHGVAVEFDHVATGEVYLAPLDLTIAETNSALFLNASGTQSAYVNYLGQAALQNSNGVLLASVSMEYSPGFIATVYSNNLLIAIAPVAARDPVIITGRPRIISAGASADTLLAPAAFSFGFDGAATFHLPDGDALGNRLVFTATNATLIADITTLALTERLLPSFAITGETSSTSYPELRITRAADMVTLRWPDPAHAYAIDFREDLTESWIPFGTSPDYQDGIASLTFEVDEGNRFYRLQILSSND